MKKIYVIGIVASGKTTFSRKLAAIAKIPHYEIDTIIRVIINNKRLKKSTEDQISTIDNIDSEGKWIIEGTYRPNLHCLFDLADTIIYMDTHYLKRRYRIVSRFVKQQLRLEHSHYKSDLNMLKLMFKWTKDFDRTKDEFEGMLDSYSDKLVVIKNERQLTNFLNGVENSDDDII